MLSYHDDLVLDEGHIVDEASGSSQPTGSLAVAGPSGAFRQRGRPVEVVDLVSSDESDSELPGLEVVPEFMAYHQASLPADRSTISERPGGSRLRARLGLNRRQSVQIMPDGYYSSSSDDEYLYEPPAVSLTVETAGASTSNQMQVDEPAGDLAGDAPAASPARRIDDSDEAFADYLQELEESLGEEEELDLYENQNYEGQDDSLLF